MGHAAHALLIHLDDGVLNFLRTFVERGTCALEERLALWLPRPHGGTATGAVDESARLHHLVDDFARAYTAVEEVLHVVHVVQEVLFHEDVGLAIHLGVIARVNHGCVIHVEVQVRLLIHLQRETLLAAVLCSL